MEVENLRLEPVEKPRGLMMRLVYWGIKRQMGKVMTPVKVLTARMPGSLKFTNAIVKFENRKIRIDQELHYLIAALTSLINGCAFCSDLARSMFIRNRVNLEKMNTLDEYETSPVFNLRERTALSYVAEITKNRKVSDGTYEALRENFSEWEIAEITWINAIENYYNLINIPLEIGSDGFCSLVQANDSSLSFMKDGGEKNEN